MENNMGEISLREIIEIFWGGKKLIAIITVAVVLLSSLYGFFIAAPTYEIQTLAMVKNISTNNNSSFLGTLIKDAGIDLNTLDSSFKSLITSQELLEEVRTIPNYQNIKLEDLKKIYKINLVPNTKSFNIFVDAKSPTETSKLYEIFINRLRYYLDAQNYNTIVSKVKSTKGQMELDIELLQNKVDSQKEELENLDKVIVYKQSIVDDPYLHQLAARLGNTNVVNLSKLSVESEVANPEYMAFLNSLSQNKLALSNLKSEYTEIVKAEKLMKEISSKNGLKLLAPEKVMKPEDPIKPRKAIILALSFILGILLGAAVVLFEAYWKRTERIEQSSL